MVVVVPAAVAVVAVVAAVVPVASVPTVTVTVAPVAAVAVTLGGVELLLELLDAVLQEAALLAVQPVAAVLALEAGHLADAVAQIDGLLARDRAALDAELEALAKLLVDHWDGLAAGPDPAGEAAALAHAARAAARYGERLLAVCKEAAGV